MRSLFKHKWIVAVSALVLTLAIGAGAWAVTGSPGERPADEGLCSGDCAGCALGEGTGSSDTGSDVTAPGFSMMGRGRGMMQGAIGSGEGRAPLGERFERMQDRLDLVLDGLRDKMTAEDQAALDQLLEKATQQRGAARRAAEELRDTMRQIHDLVDEYLPLPDDAEETTGAAGATL